MPLKASTLWVELRLHCNLDIETRLTLIYLPLKILSQLI